MANSPGLYFVATPIGNLSDFSQRAIDLLKEADLIFCEDTRHSRKLLLRFEIDKQLIPCHEHNEETVSRQVVEAIQNGKICAFVSDAGTPGISDPGFRLARVCRKEKVFLSPIPGPSAAIAALSVSGLPTDQFRFIGFPPPKKSARIRIFTTFIDDPATLIFYESTHRIEKFLSDALSVFGPDRVICVAREITKQYETIITGTIAEVNEQFAKTSHKGEFVVMVAKNEYVL